MRLPSGKVRVASAFLALSIIMSGCASTGGIAPQQTALDAAALDTGAAVRAAARSARWPDADWWRTYGDTQLDSLVSAAVAGNPTLAAADARVREAQSLAGVAAAALAPHVEGNLSITREHWADNPLYYGPGELADQTTWNNTGTLGFSYHLDLWGGDAHAHERALDAAHERAANARAAQLELEVNLVRAYVDFSKQYALRDIATDTLARQRELVALAQRRLAGGVGTQLEVSQAQAPLPEYERRIEALNEAIELDRNQLAALTGQGPGAGAALTRPALSLDASVALPSALPAELIGHRPDVVAARWAVAGAARGIDVAHAAFYPNINLMASLGGFAAGGPLFQFLHAANGSWTAGPALSLPIFEGGALRSRLGAADAGYDEAVEHYNATVVAALKQIADQIVQLHSLAAQQGDAERSASFAERSYRLAQVGFKRGLSDYVNVVVSETQWLGAQQSVAQVHAARLAAYASLMGALGGGLAAPADGPNAGTMQPSPHGTLGIDALGRHASVAAHGAGEPR
ncbi:efflux transporter outer membrane subunit [Trinickia acidisoli]|uniref:efflux transporter outer membrane subunit n=1 Tax=Trinickia acidisoli TaxID=2767482 RepID=UPI002852EAB3|nr:efflux transporter outer membrane subunit [Trinickia acidisoli]